MHNNTCRTEGNILLELVQDISWKSSEQVERTDSREKNFLPTHMFPQEKKDTESDAGRPLDRPVFSYSVFVT